jgi:hypothetical protein
MLGRRHSCLWHHFAGGRVAQRQSAALSLAAENFHVPSGTGPLAAMSSMGSPAKSCGEM